MVFLAMLIVVLISLALQVNAAPNNYKSYYSPSWGEEHIDVDPDGNQVALTLDDASGAGIRSKRDYGSGLFHMKIKLPKEKSSGGVVTTFYLISVEQDEAEEPHSELDFEFIGTTGGKLNTNIFNNDDGKREETIALWFDPSQDFHSYDILWNARHIVFFIDNIPIRVFKNNTAQGLNYGFKPMHIEASIWNATGNWVGPLDWTQAPFKAYYQDLVINGCAVSEESDASACASGKYSWNQKNYMPLSDVQKQQMKDYRTKYVKISYCGYSPDKKRECELNDQLVDDGSLWVTPPYDPSSEPPASDPPSEGPSIDDNWDEVEDMEPQPYSGAAKCVTTYVHMYVVVLGVVFMWVSNVRGLVHV